MSYYTMSNKELSQLIRKTLKESGFTSKDVSIRVRAALYDTSVNITVKNPLVRLSEVEEIVKKFSEVDYDEHSGEILAGCNVYVHCQYEYGIFKDAAADVFRAVASGSVPLIWYDLPPVRCQSGAVSVMRYALHRSTKLANHLQLSCMEIKDGCIIPTSDRQYSTLDNSGFLEFFRDFPQKARINYLE